MIKRCFENMFAEQKIYLRIKKQQIMASENLPCITLGSPFPYYPDFDFPITSSRRDVSQIIVIV